MKAVMRAKAELKDSLIDVLGKIPTMWTLCRIKNVANVQRGGSPRPIEDYLTSDKDGFNWIKIGDTLKGSKYIDSVKQKIRKEGLSKTRFVRKGTLLLTNSMSFGEAYILNLDGCIHDGWVALECNNNVKKEFLYYFLESELCKKQFGIQVAGGVVQNLNVDKIGATYIFLPDDKEQQHIVNYLDDRCSKIDAIIAEAKASIEEYKELEQAVIYEAVTKGLDKNAPMKDSGVEWIGTIPKNWSIAKIKNVIEPGKNGIKIGPFGSALTNKTSGDAEYKIYGQANLVAGDFSETKNKITEETFIQLHNYEVNPGDICISMMGTIGKCMTVPCGIKKGIMDYHLIKIRLSSLMDNRFFEYVYDKDKGGICFIQMQYEKKGSIMDGLNTTIVKGLYLPIPPIVEQQRIADYLDKCCSMFDEVMNEKVTLIEDLESYKKSLIYEVVTGKRKVVE